MTRRTLLCSAALFVAMLTLPLAAQDGAGWLKVKTNSGRTGVFVDGTYLGPSAKFTFTRRYSVSAGSHQLILREPRFEEYKTTITIKAGETTEVFQRLQRRPEVTPPFGTLKLRGFDKYDAVFLNGVYVGHADEFDFGTQRLLLKPGVHEVEIVSQAGAIRLKSTVTIQEDQVETIRARPL